MRVIILDKNSHLKFHSISLAFLVKKKNQKQISLEITRQRNKHSMTRKFVVTGLDSVKTQLCGSVEEGSYRVFIAVALSLSDLVRIATETS